MNSHILTKINNFIKYRLIELSGFLLVIVSVFLFLSIITYSGGQESFIYKSDNPNVDIKNFGGFYGSAIADFLLQSIGLIIFEFSNIYKIFFWLLLSFNSNIFENFLFLAVYNFIIEQGHISFFKN